MKVYQYKRNFLKRRPPRTLRVNNNEKYGLAAGTHFTGRCRCREVAVEEGV